jgi:pimeloyl-ACP methyl ester carboxylesterase
VSASVLLIHGGLWEPMDAEAFWGTTGVHAGLVVAGLDVHAPDRPPYPHGWAVEVDRLGEQLTKLQRPVRIVGASNGCTTAALLADRFPGLVDRLLLAWPATGSDAELNARTKMGLIDRGCPPDIAEGLLAGGVLRGVTDSVLSGLGRREPGIRVAVLPSVPENPSHQRRTVDALLRSIRGSRELAGCPEPPTPAFPPFLDRLTRTIVEFVD